MQIHNTNRRHVLKSALFLALLASHSCFVYAGAGDHPGRRNSATADHVEGEGKNATDCNMSQITIWHNGKPTVYKSADLITLPPAGHVNASARRLIQQGRPVLPLDMLIGKYPDAGKLAFESCGTEEYLEVTKSEITKTHDRYLLTFNRIGRTRLVRFENNSARGRYITVAKNVVAIKVLP